MDLERKFQETTSYHSVKISSLEVDRKYPITHTQIIVTKFRPIVLMSIRDAPFHTVKVIMTKRYGSAFSDADIEDINTAKVSLHLIYKETCDKTKSYILTIEM
jgi:hypothetical protein